MLVIIPFSDADKDILPFFVSSLVHFGPHTGHNLLIVTSDDQQENGSLDKMQALLSPLFDNTYVDVIPKQRGGWPHACNVFFKSAVIAQLSLNLPMPWFWCEPDITVTTKGAFDTLQKEYMEGVGNGLNYLGMRALTVMIETNPATGKVTRIQNGEHLVGAAVYPAYHGNKALLWKSTPVKTPFDIRGQWETHPNKLSVNMAHRWGTVNYRREGDAILCDDKKENIDGLSYSGEVPNVAFVHGCKDGSLARLFLPEKELNETIEYFNGKQTTSCDIEHPTLVTESQSTCADNMSIPVSPETHDSVLLGERSQEVFIASPSVEVVHENGGLLDDKTPEKPDTSGINLDLVKSILSVKKLRLDQLTDRLKVKKTDLQEFLINNGFTLSGPAKWVASPS